MYTIFHEKKSLIFPSIDENSLDFDATIPESEQYESEIFGKFLSQWLSDNSGGDIYIDNIGASPLSYALRQCFRMAPAAGGLVVIEGKIVTIERNGIPDLPKGHIEKDEMPEAAAMREVEEETGIAALKITKELPSTWHCYDYQGEWRLKRTRWYLMRTSDGFCPEAQSEEGITEVRLTGKAELDDFLKNTFRSISEGLGEEMKRIAE